MFPNNFVEKKKDYDRKTAWQKSVSLQCKAAQQSPGDGRESRTEECLSVFVHLGEDNVDYFRFLFVLLSFKVERLEVLHCMK